MERHLFHWCGVLALAIAQPGTGAGVYKCRGDTAAPVYQDQPCSPARELRNFDEAPAAVSVIPFAMAPAAPVPAKVKPTRPPPRAPKEAARSRAAVDPSERRHVHEGMSEGEVLARIGAPDMQAGKGGRRMRWTYLPAPGDPQTVTLLAFEDGKVKNVERKTLR
jgi:hypothetical protein